MGACEFSHLIASKKKVYDVYSDLVDEAHYAHGHDPYNGTISTTNGVTQINCPHKYGTKAFEDWTETLFERMAKRECYVAEVKLPANTAKKVRWWFNLTGAKGVKFYYFIGLAAE